MATSPSSPTRRWQAGSTSSSCATRARPGEQQFGPLEARQELEALEILADAARRHGALLAVNDRADIARAAGADVLHLGQDDLPLAMARDIIGADPLIGRSTHDDAQVAAAIAEKPDGPDYFCVGPCWPTPTKPGRPRPALIWSARRPKRERRSHGSRSAASTRTAARGARGRRASGRGGARDHRGRRPRCGGAAVEGRAYERRIDQQGDRRGHGAQSLPARGETRMQRQVGDLVLGHPAQFGALPVGHGPQHLGRVGDDGRVGPARAAAPRDLGGDHRRPHRQLISGQPGLLVRLADGGLFDGFVAVPGTARQAPRTALMTPRRAVLQQHRGRSVGARRPQQQARRAVPTPEMPRRRRTPPSRHRRHARVQDTERACSMAALRILL